MRHKFIFSSKLFSGFSKVFFTDQIESLEYVIQEIVKDLKCVLQQNNLEVLLEELKKLKFHYHGYTLIDVISSRDENQVWYICECETI